jgi:uncharacterized OB-fold protein
MVAKPIADNLYVEHGDTVHLLASTSAVGQSLVFPAEDDQKQIPVASEGTLFTWTSQEFRPPSPPYVGSGDFTRYGVGYVEFPEGILIEGILTTCDPEALTIGGAMRTVIISLGDVQTFAFEPVGTENGK